MFLPLPVCVKSSEVLVSLVSCTINTESILNLRTTKTDRVSCTGTIWFGVLFGSRVLLGSYMGVVIKVWPHMSYKCALNEFAGSHYTLQDNNNIFLTHQNLVYSDSLHYL